MCPEYEIMGLNVYKIGDYGIEYVPRVGDQGVEDMHIIGGNSIQTAQNRRLED